MNSGLVVSAEHLRRMELKACILQNLHSRKISRPRTKIGVPVKELADLIPGVDEDLMWELVDELASDQKIPLKFASRAEESVLLTNKEKAIHQAQEMRREIWQRIEEES